MVEILPQPPLTRAVRIVSYGADPELSPTILTVRVLGLTRNMSSTTVMVRSSSHAIA